MVQFFAKINNDFSFSTISSKNSILDARDRRKYTPATSSDNFDTYCPIIIEDLVHIRY